MGAAVDVVDRCGEKDISIVLGVHDSVSSVSPGGRLAADLGSVSACNIKVNIENCGQNARFVDVLEGMFKKGDCPHAARQAVAVGFSNR